MSPWVYSPPWEKSLCTIYNIISSRQEYKYVEATEGLFCGLSCWMGKCMSSGWLMETKVPWEGSRPYRSSLKLRFCICSLGHIHIRPRSQVSQAYVYVSSVTKTTSTEDKVESLNEGGEGWVPIGSRTRRIYIPKNEAHVIQKNTRPIGTCKPQPLFEKHRLRYSEQWLHWSLRPWRSERAWGTGLATFW